LGRDLLSKLHFTFSFTTLSTTQDQSHVLFLMVLTNFPPSSAPNSLPLTPHIVNPIVWDISSPSVSSHHSPIKIYLKDPKSHPNRPQYPISLKHSWGLKPVIDKLLAKKILKPTHSPCNTPILLVLKPDGSYRLVQDLRVVNSAVLPIYPVVLNPYALLSRIPSDTFYFSVPDLKDAFFTIPLHPDCHSLFAFMWEDPASGLAQQLTWTVLPQGFRDSSHFFGQALTQDLSSLDLQPSTLLQYGDDLLLCSHTITCSQDHTALLLNFLAQKGYHLPRLSFPHHKLNNF
jgi:hypothetical protein